MAMARLNLTKHHSYLIFTIFVLTFFPAFIRVQSSSVAAAAAAAPPAKVEIGSLPVRAYLDQTVVPLLLQGMAQLVKEVRQRGTFESLLTSHLFSPPLIISPHCRDRQTLLNGSEHSS
jgi:hypothetical protein